MLAFVVDPELPRPDYVTLLKRALEHPSMTTAAAAVALRRHGESPAERVAAIADRLEQLVQAAASPNRLAPDTAAEV